MSQRALLLATRDVIRQMPQGLPSSTLAGNATSGATTISVASSASMPASAFYLRIDAEFMLVTAGFGTTTLTVTRGVLNTTAAAHSSGANITTPGLFPQNYCEVQFDGAPPPTCGMYFIAVHAAGWENRNENGTCLDEFYGVDVTVTVRATVQPKDRLGPNLLAGPGGQCLDVILEGLRAFVSGNYTLMTLANTGAAYSIGDGVTASGFKTPLWFKNGDIPQEQGPAWFSAEGDTLEDSLTPAPTGLSQTLHFGESNRVQDIAGQT